MASGIHHVIVWTRERNGQRLFTLTARKAAGARLDEVEPQVEAAGFKEVLREKGLNEEQAKARKKVLKAKYQNEGYQYRTRKALPQNMMG